MNEEPGWRGLALPWLQAGFTPLTASVIIGAFWGLWHLRLHLMSVFPHGAIGAVIRVFDIRGAIVFSWLYNRTRQSLLPVLFLHAARNATSLFLSRHYVISSLLLLLLATALVFLDMSGNAWEWCTDTGAPYSTALQLNPYNQSGSKRIIRGGTYPSDARLDWWPFAKCAVSSFRLALSAR